MNIAGNDWWQIQDQYSKSPEHRLYQTTNYPGTGMAENPILSDHSSWDYNSRPFSVLGSTNYQLPIMIKAVLFDLDDTLVVEEAVTRETFELVAAKAVRFGVEGKQFVRDARALAREFWSQSPYFSYCRAIGINAFECLWGIFDDEQKEICELGIWARNFREAVFDGALRRQLIESPTAGSELAREFEVMRRRLQRLMPDAKEVVVRLSRIYRLGMLTNGAPSLQREKIAASGLASYFQAIVISGDMGIGKPRAEIFLQLIGKLGVSPSETVMVGNSKERDILGARNAGMRSVWLRVPGAEESYDVEPDAEISGLSKLPDCIEEMNRQLGSKGILVGS